MTRAGSETEGKRGASTAEAAFAGAVSGGAVRCNVTLASVAVVARPNASVAVFRRDAVAGGAAGPDQDPLPSAARTDRERPRRGQFSAAPSPVISAANGAVAGVTATVVTYPLDLFRTAFASQGMPKRFPTMQSLAVHMWTTQGLRGFYSGLGATIFQIAPYMGLSFGIYSTLNEVSVKYRSKQAEGDADAWMPLSTALSYVGSGAAAGLLSKLAVYPLDTVKKRMQMRHVPRCATYGVIPIYSTSWACFFDVLGREGIRGLYKGTVPSLLKSVVAASSTFATYELTLEVLRHVSMHEDREEWADLKTLDRE
ncbi:unnamed protein product [Phytophthora lilii]|uniref:Unnamed protein product n=1 Tax=Phytophthora lilii TaxID=2077276 RepID=A0A9W6TFU5_9STRA|nr:unnamed protein product [Phytophthora lilii]